MALPRYDRITKRLSGIELEADDALTMHGGSRPGSGRPRGSQNKRTQARLKIVEHAAAEGITPLEVMLQTMRALWAEGSDDSRLAACKIAEDAAPYVHPRLSAVEQKTTFEGDTLAALMQAIDGRTTGIRTGNEAEAAGPALAPEQPVSHH